MIIHLDSPDLAADPRLNDYTRLKDVALRSRIEPERGLYMAESTNVIMRALQVGHAPRSFLMSPKWLPGLAGLIAGATGSPDGGDVPIFMADEPLLEQIAGFHLHRGALAAMERPELPPVGGLLATARHGAPARRVVVLEDLVDHTNVGAAFRSAAALGVDAVLVTPRCADPLYRRSVRVSMGTVFQVPWTRLSRWPAMDELHDAGFTVAALALSDDSIGLDDFAASPACTDPTGRLALVMGTEGDGLGRRTIASADVVVRIPMAGGVDSLNVAAASAVAFWATRVTED
ncbi:RNA methyltransferase [Actinomyces sp. B33]|uniref:TrmH family RNA methyltransferase n=1 Tax=Actinomyces sp. B33 TaxID=2942131 RepID=UPI002341E8C1|nr:RNA methyltransferase [Actinomyces sp. B33]MDC4232928.1 RNA methyltransferase [Actinomyces sp. B33]